MTFKQQRIGQVLADLEWRVELRSPLVSGRTANQCKTRNCKISSTTTFTFCLPRRQIQSSC